MAVAFGFSFGDFVAALELVSTIVNTLGPSSELSHKYRELVRQLYYLDDAQEKELAALRQRLLNASRLSTTSEENPEVPTASAD